VTITQNETPEIEPGVDRRKMIRNVTIAAAAAAVGGAALASQEASADTGDPLLVGTSTTGTSPTALTAEVGYDGSSTGTGALHVTNDAGATLDPSVETVAISAVVDETGPGSLGTAFYGAATSTGAVLDAPVPLQLLDSTSTTAPDLTVGTAGQFRVVDGSLWYCAQSDSGSTEPAVWIQLASAAGAGNLVAIDPVRVYDSRQAVPGDGRISQTQSRTVSVKDARGPSGTVTTPDAIPEGAKAIAFNLTLTETLGTFGYLSMVPGDATATPTTSSINWDAPGRTIANGGVVRIAADRTVKVFCSDAQSIGSTQFAIDVTGYYL
jgi:hypothetical protein